jgi:hypothetical protein
VLLGDNEEAASLFLLLKLNTENLKRLLLKSVATGGLGAEGASLVGLGQ